MIHRRHGTKSGSFGRLALLGPVLGGPLGAAAGPLPALEPPPEARERAVELLSRRGLKGAPYAILGPGASYGPAKRWAAERFAALGRALAGRGLGVLVCGNGAERELCLNVAAEVGGGALALAGETDLGLQAGLCEGTAVAVCNDSGLAHLSASTGAPTVVIFGSTSSAWTAPLGPRVRIVQRAPVCAPCFRRTCRIARALTGAEQAALKLWVEGDPTKARKYFSLSEKYEHYRDFRVDPRGLGLHGMAIPCGEVVSLTEQQVLDHPLFQNFGRLQGEHPPMRGWLATSVCGADSLCATPSCMDGVQNGEETAKDCGGTGCPKCLDGLGCALTTDCVSGLHELS